MAEHECLFDHALLGEHKLPPHDRCLRDTAPDGPNIYTLHWYGRLACVIQAGGQVLAFNKQLQMHFDSLDKALPYIQCVLHE